MAQQTAVNFLINYMCANFHLTDESLQKFEQAKQMEKEQIEKAYYTDCISRPVGVLTPLMPIFKPFENYFKETYGKEMQ